jgi:hypothetical protein
MLQRKTAWAIARHEFYEDEGTTVLLPVGTAETALKEGGFSFNTYSALYLTFLAKRIWTQVSLYP